MVNLRLRQWVSGLFLVGGILLFPYPVVSLDPPPVPCHNAERCFAKLLVELDQLESGSTHSAKAKKIYHQLATAYGQTPWVKRAQLRYGHTLRTVNPVEAIPLLRTSLTDFPVLDDYLHFWLFQAYVNAQLWSEAAKVIQEFTDGHHESRVRAEVLYEGGKVLARMGDCQAARSVLSQALAVGPRHSRVASALFQIGTCGGQLGQKQEMVEIFRKLWWRFPLAPESRQAEQWLAQEGGSAFVPTLGERYQRGKALYKRGALTEAVKEFQQVVAVSRKTPLSFPSSISVSHVLVSVEAIRSSRKGVTSAYPIFFLSAK